MLGECGGLEMNVGQNIRTHRKRIGLTQKELGAKIGKVESAVRMWELGKNEPSLSSLMMLKRIFEITLDELVE